MIIIIVSGPKVCFHGQTFRISDLRKHCYTANKSHEFCSLSLERGCGTALTVRLLQGDALPCDFGQELVPA